MSKNSFIFLTILSCGILVSPIVSNGSFTFLEFSNAAGQQQQQQIPSSSSSTPAASTPLPSAQQTEKQIQQQESTWTTTGANLNITRSEITSAILDGKIYVIGGLNATGKNIAVVEVYDPDTDKWSNNTASPLPEQRDHAAAAAYNGKLYVVGGYDNMRNPSNKLFIYDLATNKWQEGKPMPTARGALTAAFINGTLYAIGGNSTVPLNTSEAYNPQNNTWIQKAPMPTARHHHASAVVDGKLYVFGGRQLDNLTKSFIITLDKNEMYDSKKNTWITLEPMPSKRGGLTAANSSDGQIYVIGGELPPGSNETIRMFYNNEKYDPKSNNWTSQPPMLTARHGLAAETIGDKIYVIAGGIKPGLSVSNLNEIFQIKGH
jgi:N-acetylneuraminic acid mutarotase